MKRTLLAVALAASAAAAFAASEPTNNQYRNNAGQEDRQQQQVGAISGSTLLASAYHTNAGDSTSDNVLQTQVG